MLQVFLSIPLSSLLWILIKGKQALEKGEHVSGGKQEAFNVY